MSSHLPSVILRLRSYLVRKLSTITLPPCLFPSPVLPSYSPDLYPKDFFSGNLYKTTITFLRSNFLFYFLLLLSTSPLLKSSLQGFSTQTHLLYYSGRFPESESRFVPVPHRRCLPSVYYTRVYVLWIVQIITLLPLQGRENVDKKGVLDTL